MREIKFRAWHEIDKKWLHGYGDHHEGCSIRGETIVIGGWLSECHGLLDQNNVIIEQFTGLRDKNGHEIYEGDIVRFDVIASDRGPEKLGQTGIVQDVPRYGWGIGGYSPAWIKNEKVIGNVHENPELLNEAVCHCS